MPRPTKLNAKRTQQICDYVAQGHTREVAAQACGIVSTTLYRWMKRGEQQPDGPYGEFCSALNRADLEAELACLRQIKEAAQNGDWRAAAWSAGSDRVCGSSDIRNAGAALTQSIPCAIRTSSAKVCGVFS
jgi:transposase-like protein